MVSFEEETKAFEEWMHKKGIERSSKVELHDYREEGQGRGLIAKDDIAPGELLFKVPQSTLIAVRNNKEVQRLVEKHNLEPWPALIAYMLLLAESEEWKPYFDVLPHSFSTLMFWNEEQLRLLAGSTIVDEIGREDAEQMYAKVKETVLADPKFDKAEKSLEAFHRMGSLIMAYGFDVDVTGEGEHEFVAMVPLADMLNSHTKHSNARLEMPNNEDGDLEMRATRAIAKGQQVYNSYGEVATRTLLRRYGYVEEGGTEFDIAEISVKELIAALAETLDIEQQVIEERWEKLGDVTSELDLDDIDLDEYFSISRDGIPSLELLVATMSLDTEPTKDKVTSCLSLAEEETLTETGQKSLLRVLRNQVEKYPTKTELKPAKSHVYTAVEDMALQLVKMEKQILELAIEWIEGCDVVRPTKRAKQ